MKKSATYEEVCATLIRQVPNCTQCLHYAKCMKARKPIPHAMRVYEAICAWRFNAQIETQYLEGRSMSAKIMRDDFGFKVSILLYRNKSPRQFNIVRIPDYEEVESNYDLAIAVEQRLDEGLKYALRKAESAGY